MYKCLKHIKLLNGLTCSMFQSLLSLPIHTKFVFDCFRDEYESQIRSDQSGVIRVVKGCRGLRQNSKPQLIDTKAPGKCAPNMQSETLICNCVMLSMRTWHTYLWLHAAQYSNWRHHQRHLWKPIASIHELSNVCVLSAEVSSFSRVHLLHANSLFCCSNLWACIVGPQLEKSFASIPFSFTKIIFQNVWAKGFKCK